MGDLWPAFKAGLGEEVASGRLSSTFNSVIALESAPGRLFFCRAECCISRHRLAMGNTCTCSSLLLNCGPSAHKDKGCHPPQRWSSCLEMALEALPFSPDVKNRSITTWHWTLPGTQCGRKAGGHIAKICTLQCGRKTFHVVVCGYLPWPDLPSQAHQP